MSMNKIGWVALLTTLASTNSTLACDLKVEGAWIREAPPNAMAAAAYAKLSNTGATTLRIQSITTTAFATAEAHESITENGISMMRPVTIEIPAKGSVMFAAGGKHLMLMNPKLPLKKDDVVTLMIKEASGCTSAVPFKVRAFTQADSMESDHAKMKHQ